MSKKISSERKAIYYLGIFFIVAGSILFISGFMIEDDPGFSMISSGPPAFFKRAVIGMVSIIIGAILTNIGSKGIAGSGLILDPEKAREDLKPFNTAKGEMINDVLENIDMVQNLTNEFGDRRSSNGSNSKEVVKIRCRECGTINEEDAKFCKDCGKII
jgi:hypothetical protein